MRIHLKSMKIISHLFSLIVLFIFYGCSLEIRIRDGRPSGDDSYLCSAHRMPEDKNLYLTSFKKAWNTTNAHHMIIMSCNIPGSDEPNWNCKPHSKTSKPACLDQTNFIFSWAMEAPGFVMPPDTSFKVGRDAPNTQYLILQVHYKNADKFDKEENLLDDSGFEIDVKTKPTKFSVGILLSETGGTIPPNSLVYLEALCQENPTVPLTPIAFRVHAHRLCDLISVFRIRDDKWSAIGIQSPKKPQTFYPINDTSVDIIQGDLIATRCVMNNTLNDEQVNTGDNADDEMCNSYLMYSYPSNMDPGMDNVCSSEGFPDFSWTEFFSDDEIPIEAKKNLETGELMDQTFSNFNVEDEAYFASIGY